MNRIRNTYGFANEHMHYERDLAGNIRQFVDPKPATYFFDYDAMNRKTGATYPLDATGTPRTESWHYDFASNLDQYTNPAGQTKTSSYDTRNRLYHSSWNSGSGPTLGLGYYDNSQLGIIVTYNLVTNNEDTRVVFGYDAANRQTWEEQTVAGFPMRRVETPRDADGSRSSLNVPGWYGLQYDYTQRNQLWHIKDGNGGQWFTYSYDPSGNMTKRQAVYGGVNDSTNIMDSSGVSQYDQLNRPMIWEQTGTLNGVSNTAFARSHFNYDNLGRLTASWRDEQASKGEWFGYNATGQLTDVFYNADGVSTNTPQNASRTVSYTITPDTLNRSSVNDSGDQSNYAPNPLNQYENVAGGDIYYDENFNLLWTGGLNLWHDSANRLTWAQSGEDYGQFVYDGLGRCLKRTIDRETTLIAYDGWQPIVEWDEFGYFKAWNIYGPGADEILWRYSDRSGHLRYHSDRQGNVVALLDYNGNGIESYTYDAFGKPTVTDWSGQNPRPYSSYWNRFMFTGREYFPELGFYDFRNRFYYPALGRFLQADPIAFAGGDANLYRYCADDPVNWVDPFGLWQVTIFAGKGLGAVFSFGSNSGQWNSGAYIGWGVGAFINVNLGEQASRPPGNVTSGMATFAPPSIGILGARVTGYYGEDGKWVSATGRLGRVSDGLRYDGRSLSNTGGSITFGGGTFLGLGATAYDPIDSTSPAPPPGGTTEVDPSICPGCATTERVTVTSAYLPSTPSLGSFHVDPNTFFSPGHGSGLNSGSQGGASAAAVIATIFQTLAGVPGGGGQPGEGSHPVPFELN